MLVILNKRNEPFWSGIHPCVLQRLHDDISLGELEMNAGRSPPAPAIVDGAEHARVRLHVSSLLNGSEFHHTALGIWPAQSRENLATDPNVGMVHVLSFCCFRQAERQGAKFACCHLEELFIALEKEFPVAGCP